MTSIADIFERRHPRTGVLVHSLIVVFAQIDALHGLPPQFPLRPTREELAAYEIQWGREYSWRSTKTATYSLRRAHAQFEKGWLTREEHEFIERMCTAKLAGP